MLRPTPHDSVTQRRSKQHETICRRDEQSRIRTLAAASTRAAARVARLRANLRLLDTPDLKYNTWGDPLAPELRWAWR
eukprot:scaffold55493_cov30-Tisochrysis_lutea.AAC.2